MKASMFKLKFAEGRPIQVVNFCRIYSIYLDPKMGHRWVVAINFPLKFVEPGLLEIGNHSVSRIKNFIREKFWIVLFVKPNAIIANFSRP